MNVILIKTAEDKFYRDVLINSIDLEPYGIENDSLSEQEKIDKAYEIFLSEKSYEIKRLGRFMPFTDWLQGLPSALTVPFYNYEILEAVKDYGIKLDTEEKEDKFLEKYWQNLAYIFVFELISNELKSK